MARQEHLEIFEAMKTTSSYFFSSAFQEYLEKDGVIFVFCSMKCKELNLSCSKQRQRCSFTFFTEHSRMQLHQKNGSLPASTRFGVQPSDYTKSMGLSMLLGGKSHSFWSLDKVLIHLPTRMTRFLKAKSCIFFIVFHFVKAYMNIRD